MTTIAERVAAGAAWLDEHRPGWVDRIDLETLDLGDCANCIVGQEFGEIIPHRLPEAVRDYNPDLGFDAYAENSRPSYTHTLLGREWRRLIEARRRPGGTADAFETPAEIAAYDRARDV